MALPGYPLNPILQHGLPGLSRRSNHASAMVCLAVLLLFSAFPLPCSAQGVITTVAGSEWIFPAGPLPATEAPLGFVAQIAVDSAGTVVATDSENNLVVRISSAGVLTCGGGKRH